MKKSRSIFCSFVLIFGFSAAAFGQDYETEEVDQEAASRPVDKKAQDIAKQKKLKIQFDDELIRGQQASPEVDYIFSRSQFNYKKMIRIRDNFGPELEKGKGEFSGKH